MSRALINGISVLIKDQRDISLSLPLPFLPHEDTERKQPSVNLEVDSPQAPHRPMS